MRRRKPPDPRYIARRKREHLAVWRHRLWLRQRGRCYWCGQPIPHNATAGAPECLTVDHLIPRSRGGTDSPLNLVAAHKVCNELRGNPTYNPRAKGRLGAK